MECRWAPQVSALRKNPDIVVATPGRLLDLMNQGYIKLDQVEMLVLDEADRMLDMGFIHDVRRIVETLPKKRQTMLFSATLSKDITALAGDMLDKPVNAAVTPAASVSERIDQQVLLCRTRWQTRSAESGAQGRRRAPRSGSLRGPSVGPTG